MVRPAYTIETTKIDGRFEALVQETGAIVNAPTEHAVLAEACRAIHLAMIEEHRNQKRRKRGKDRTA